jgi:hypothetical protein
MVIGKSNSDQIQTWIGGLALMQGLRNGIQTWKVQFRCYVWSSSTQPPLLAAPCCHPPPPTTGLHRPSQPLPTSCHCPPPPITPRLPPSPSAPSRMRRMTAQGPCSCHQRSDPPGSSSTSSQVRALLLTHTSRSSKCLHHRCSSPSLLRFSGVR